MKVILTKSKPAGNKYAVRVGNKTIHFGAQGYEDFTTHKDPKRKANYLARHRHDNWNDPTTAGFGARHLLWNKDTLEGAIRDMQRSGFDVHFF